MKHDEDCFNNRYKMDTVLKMIKQNTFNDQVFGMFNPIRICSVKGFGGFEYFF